MMTSLSASTVPPGPTLVRHHLEPGDLGRIVALHATICAREFGVDPLWEAHVAHSLAEMVRTGNAGDRLWIAEGGGRIVGCVALVALSPRDAQIRWFLSDARPGERNPDRQLMEEAIEFSYECGYEHLFSWILRDSPAARLHSCLGFRKVCERTRARGAACFIEECYVLDPTRPPTS